MKSQTFRAAIAAGPVAVLLAAMLMAEPAQAQSSWFAGAFATNGDRDCVGQGLSPTNGCSAVPGLTFATAFLYGRETNDNFTTGTANLANASLAIQTRSPIVFTTGSGGANFRDTFTIVGDLPSPVDVTVMLTIDATMAAPDGYSGGPMAVGMANEQGTRFYYERYINAGRCDGPFPSGYACDRGIGNISRTISYTETVDNNRRSFVVTAALYGSGPLALDATAIMSLGLPQGLSYTTASGVFPVPAVPEPHSWALMLAGLVFVGVHRRGKTRVLGAGSPEH